MILFKNNILAAILFASKTEIDAMLLRLSNLSCDYLFVATYAMESNFQLKLQEKARNY